MIGVEALTTLLMSEFKYYSELYGKGTVQQAVKEAYKEVFKEENHRGE